MACLFFEREGTPHTHCIDYYIGGIRIRMMHQRDNGGHPFPCKPRLASRNSFVDSNVVRRCFATSTFAQRALVHTEAHGDDADASVQAVNNGKQRRRGPYKCSKCGFLPKTQEHNCVGNLHNGSSNNNNNSNSNITIHIYHYNHSHHHKARL